MKTLRIGLAVGICFTMYASSIQAFKGPNSDSLPAISLSLQQNLKSNEFDFQIALTNKNSIKPTLKRVLDNLARAYPNYRNVMGDVDAVKIIGAYVHLVAGAKKIDLQTVHRAYGDQLINDINEVIDEAYSVSRKEIMAKQQQPGTIHLSPEMVLKFIDQDLKKNQSNFAAALEKRYSIRPLLKESFIRLLKLYPQSSNQIKDSVDLQMVISNYLYPIAQMKNIDLNQRDAAYGDKLITDINAAIDEFLLPSNDQQSQQKQQKSVAMVSSPVEDVLSSLRQNLKNNQFNFQIILAKKDSLRSLLKTILSNVTQKHSQYKKIVKPIEMIRAIGDYVKNIASGKKIDLEKESRDYGNQLIFEINDAVDEVYL